MTVQQLRQATAAMLVVSTFLFFGAVEVERGGRIPESPHVEQSTESEAAVHSESGEADKLAVVAGVEHHDEATQAEERLFGLNLESPFLIWGFVAVSLVLAAAIFGVASPFTLWLAVALGAVAALSRRCWT